MVRARGGDYSTLGKSVLSFQLWIPGTGLRPVRLSTSVFTTEPSLALTELPDIYFYISHKKSIQP